ncbi:hypothetical protein B0H14DRAFT_2576654 [Mycena olivaceomarginata]|nr:hypothetical protein B0H14DRAFT_2576654 [Mycena olivaceomarginata]
MLKPWVLALFLQLRFLRGRFRQAKTASKTFVARQTVGMVRAMLKPWILALFLRLKFLRGGHFRQAKTASKTFAVRQTVGLIDKKRLRSDIQPFQLLRDSLLGPARHGFPDSLSVGSNSS